VSWLGECANDQLGQTSPLEDVGRAWNQFFNSVEVTKLSPKILNELRGARQESLGSSSIREIVEGDLTVAHEKGHLLVKSILESNGLHSRFCEPASLCVSYDHEAKYYCAATSPATGQIRWVHQPVAHALYGALVPDLIFAHEYLSHLIPRNPLLDRSIQETWLVAALTEWLEAYGDPVEDRAWRRQVWFQMREELRKHLIRKGLLRDTRQDQVRLDGLFGVYEFALVLYGASQPIFWRLTGEMLSLTKGSELKLLQLLNKMLADPLGWRKTLVDGNWREIKAFF
jgi:hypothetical protein